MTESIIDGFDYARFWDNHHRMVRRLQEKLITMPWYPSDMPEHPQYASLQSRLGNNALPALVYSAWRLMNEGTQEYEKHWGVVRPNEREIVAFCLLQARDQLDKKARIAAGHAYRRISPGYHHRCCWGTYADGHDSSCRFSQSRSRNGC